MFWRVPSRPALSKVLFGSLLTLSVTEVPGGTCICRFDAYILTGALEFHLLISHLLTEVASSSKGQGRRWPGRDLESCVASKTDFQCLHSLYGFGGLFAICLFLFLLAGPFRGLQNTNKRASFLALRRRVLGKKKP